MTMNKVQSEQIKNLQNKVGDNCSAIKEIRDNHLVHIKQDIECLKTDVSWIKRVQWYAITTSIGTLITVLISLLLLVNKQ